MPITMHEQFRTQERYRFLKGKITQISKDKVTILPYGETQEVVAVFDPQVTNFWKGGFEHTQVVKGKVGDQGTAATFADDQGRLIVETLLVNHEQVRGTLVQSVGNTLIVEQDNQLATLDPKVTLTLRAEALDFHDAPVNFAQLRVGQKVIAQGEILHSGHVDVYRIETF